MLKAKLVTTDKCDHPECCGARADAEHLFWDCAKFSDIRRPFLLDIERNITKVQEHSPQRARAMREAISHRCFRCCGVCNGNDKAQQLTDELAREFDDAFMAVDPNRLVRHDEHARRNHRGYVVA